MPHEVTTPTETSADPVMAKRKREADRPGHSRGARQVGLASGLRKEVVLRTKRYYRRKKASLLSGREG